MYYIAVALHILQNIVAKYFDPNEPHILAQHSQFSVHNTLASGKFYQWYQ